MASKTLIGWQRVMLALIAGLPLLALIFGWALDADWFRLLRPRGLSPIAPATALCFLTLGGALLTDNLLTDRRSGTGPVPPVLFAGSFAVVAIALGNIALTLIEGRGLDLRMLPGRMQPFEAMSVATSFSFVLAGIAGLLLATHRAQGGRGLFVILTTIGLILATFALVGRLLGADEPYTSFIFSAMPPRIGVLMFMLFLSLMLAHGEGWIWLLLGPGVGSSGARRLFPVVVIGPPLLFTLALAVMRTGLLNTSMRATLLAIILMAAGLIATLRNARRQNGIEAQLKGTLAELGAAVDDKEMLLREVYHRVKNNMQATDALIAVESTKFTDPVVLESFRAMSGRVQALAMVHQMLIQSDRPSRISTVRFLSELCASIEAGNGMEEGAIRLVQDVEDDELDLDAAIQVGLLVNELIANSIKHAFRDRERGTITVRYRSLADDGVHRSVSVSDDGIGMPPAADAETMTRSGIGTRLIRGIVVQLKGELRIETQAGAGTAAHILFPAGTG